MIDRLFELAGCEDRYRDAFGAHVEVSTETQLAILNALGYDVHDEASASQAYFSEKLEQDSRRVQPVYVVKVAKSARWPGKSGKGNRSRKLKSSSSLAKPAKARANESLRIAGRSSTKCAAR